MISTSHHFKHSIRLIGVAVLLALGAFLWLLHRLNRDTSGYVPPGAVLGPHITERVVFNEKKHTLTVTTRKKTIKEYAKNPDVQITDKGDVILGRHLAGFENDWFMGAGYADCGRLFIGANVFHFGRFNLLGTVGFAPDTSKTLLRVYAGVGYNIWSNTSINVALDPVNLILSYPPQVAGFISVKF